MLALLDPRHVFHQAAHRWAAQTSDAVWLTCPIVQNGVLRVASQPRYPNSLGSVGAVREVLRVFAAHPRHEFCADDISLLDGDALLQPQRLTPAAVTDVYLLLLAARNNATLATFDTRIPVDAVRNGRNALTVIHV